MAALSEIAPLQRNTLGDRIHAELSEFLMSGRMQPGERLSLRQLAEQLGVSIMPVRDAVGRLASDGVLIVEPNRAVRVPLMSRKRLQELTEVRLVVEGFAVRRAAQARSDADLDRISRLCDAFHAQVSAPALDVPGALRANMELHFAVYEASGFASLVALIRPLWLKVGPVLNLDFGSAAERFSEATADAFHRDLVAALKKGDAAGAQAALVADIEAAANFILSRLPEEKGSCDESGH